MHRQWLVIELQLTPPPALSSLTTCETEGADLLYSNTHTLCLRRSDRYTRWCRPEVLRDTLQRCPRMQQLSIAHDKNNDWFRIDPVEHVFPPPSNTPTALSSLVYLDFLRGATLNDCRYLLASASPPCFAAQLTHFALRVRWLNREAVAELLPSLPAMYRSLTHVHVGVEGKSNNEPLAECEHWDAAVQAVRAIVGGAWRDSVDDVLACRADVAWRHSVGVPAQEWLPVVQ